ncbi:MAG: zinc ribbon domain-containing protein [Kiritimatiellae bacterium]|nr:zinc ribbon domain-containing protein [Kiritimatiellia bacterium]
MKRAKGTFWMRFSILLLAVLFGLLVYWSIEFLLDDIRVFRMPDREAFFKQRVDAALQEELENLELRLQELDHRQHLISQQREFIKDSSSALKITVDNLFALKDRSQQLISETQFEQVLATLDRIITIQDEFKETAERYLATTNERFELTKQIAALKKRIETQTQEVRKQFAEVAHQHRVRSTMVKLAFLLPLIVGCSIVLVRKRSSIYRLIYFSAAVAVYIKATLIVHEYFPSRYFKYILTIVLLALVGWGFTWLIRRLVRPKVETLLKQYREAYERFLCPVCEYPIRTGPRTYLYWTRRTVHKTALMSGPAEAGRGDEPYTCPSCGTALFEKCAACGAICHSLLPNCRHCGNKKTITGDAY